VNLYPEYGEDERSAENVKLYAKLPAEIEEHRLGLIIVEALDLFDTEPPDFEPWETEKLNKNLKKWLGAKGQNDIKINTRLVDVVRWIDRGGDYEITPYDNCNLDQWCGPIEQDRIVLPSTVSILEVGKAVRQAFERATHHPDYLS